MAQPYGYCNECKAYTDLRHVELTSGKWGYKCDYAGHTFTTSGQPAHETTRYTR